MDTPMKMDTYLEVDRYLPAIVLGHEVSGERASLLEAVEDPPPWLVWWEHQHGGLACLHVTLTGMLLPLEALPVSAERTAVINEVWKLASEAPKGRINSTWLGFTAGKPYDAQQLALLDELMGRAFSLPLMRGREAFVEFDKADWAETFRDWPVVAYEIPMQCSLADPDAHHLIMGEREVTHRLDAPLVAVASSFFRDLGFGTDLRAYFVWFNSD
ncbi:MAG: hypothetical protein AB8H86_30915 [Polyangiales bacterium]